MRRFLPWIGAVAIVWIVLTRIDAREVFVQLRTVNAPAFVAAMLALTWAVLAGDALATTRIFRAVGARVSYASIFAARANSYLLGVINYHAGQAHLTLLLTRIHKMPLARVTAGTLVGYATVLGAMVGLAAATLPFSGPQAAWISRTVGVSVLAGLLYGAVLLIRPSFLRRIPVVGVLLEVGALGHARLLLWRIPHLACLLLEYWVAYRFFDVNVPFREALVYLPIVLLVSGLPVTPMGLGTRELAAVSLLGPFAFGTTDGARGARVVACGAALLVATVLSQTVIGLIFARKSAQRFARGDTPPAAS